ncbi:VWA domain-containing protein [Candidatus Liberibacter asiaticus]|uniref:TadE/TadG family type IV pilus assembly protein n=1 Tax=Liberibacter asiaticus TaxID=34021 RepID=UPI00234ADBC2|nr:VWA domain-containing protein [Candidatus Liberibacter asiaticus]WCM57317.1 VWA domain-containing protein [Candidatus Liberibacter asiaticus]
MTAIIISVCFLFITYAIDLAHIMYIRNQMQSALDAAVLSGCASIVSDRTIKDPTTKKDQTSTIFKKQIKKHLKQGSYIRENAGDIAQKAQINITKDKNNPLQYIAESKAQYEIPTENLFLKGLIPSALTNLSLRSTGIIERSSENLAISICMVLDVSRSMEDLYLQKHNDNNNMTSNKYLLPPPPKKSFWSKNTTKSKYAPAPAPANRKIDVLIESAGNLVNSIQKAIQEKKNLSVRIGTIAYNIGIVGNQCTPLSNNLNEVKSRLNKLNPYENTNTYPAMHHAYRELYNEKESSHNTIGSTRLKKFVIFITDGKNSGASAYQNTLNTLQICEYMRNAGMKIYSVAVSAPPEGQDLLRKCTDSSGQFFAVNDSRELLESFDKITDKIQEQSVRIAPNR